MPRRHDPSILACGLLASGRRVFDIRDPLHAREVAYVNPPLTATAESNGSYGRDLLTFTLFRRRLPAC